MTKSMWAIEMDEDNTCEFCFAKIQPLSKMTLQNYVGCSKIGSSIDECKGNLKDRPERCPLGHIEID